MEEHEIKKHYGGREEMSWIQAECSCGWSGKKHYAYNDYQRSNLKEEIHKHIRLGT